MDDARPLPLPECPRCDKPLTTLNAQPAPPVPNSRALPAAWAYSCPHCDVLLGLLHDTATVSREIRRSAKS